MAKYHYTQCGLPNVWLDGLTTTTTDDGEELTMIPAVKRLHKALAEAIIARPGSLSGAELRFLRTEMRKTQANLAPLVSKDVQTIGRWERGETAIDRNADAVIRLLVAEALALTMPRVEDVARNAAATEDRVVVYTVDGSDPTNLRVAA
ncbi:MAG: transcriptional regulator [Alphaproteobacteria bacterium]|nr:MAG: transcriptional regulator [Alphaproteobacteria bacterium]